MSNVDAKLRVQLRSEACELQKRQGVTTLYVTHRQIEAMTMADKILVLKSDLVEQIGMLLGLYNRPANAFAAAFIGAPVMNMLPGMAESGQLHLIPDFAGPLGGSGQMTPSLRPDHITARPANGSVPATVVSI